MISIWSAKNFTPLSWFSAGQQGAWYDPSDLTTLYQDSAGTTPVTAVEQPVGKMLDKSGRGNHAIQATAGNRPTLSARVNFLTYTEDLSNAIWSKTSLNINTRSNNLTGLAGAFIGSGNRNVQQASTVLNSSCKCYVDLKAGALSWAAVTIFNSLAVGTRVAVNLATCTLGSRSDFGSPVNPVVSIADMGNGICRITLQQDSTSSTMTFRVYPLDNDQTTGFTSTATDTTTPLIYYSIADFRPINAGALLPAYQRVNAATDYNTVGFPLYLKCNGTSSSMATNSIDFTATNQMTVVSGVRKLSDAGQGILSELSTTSATNNGSFTLSAPAGASANYSWLSKGTVADTITSGTFTAPITNVISGLSSIGAPSNAMRINGTVQSANSNSEGTGNYGNYPLYLFARNNASLWFNGQFYGAIIVGQTQTTQQIQQAEQYMATKTGISF